MTRAVKPAARRSAALLVPLLAALMLLLVLSAGAAAASVSSMDRTPTGGETVMPPPQIRELMTLLADPKVRDWLEKQHLAEASHGPEPDATTNSVSRYFDTRVGAIREHIAALAAAFPELPDQFKRIGSLLQTDLEDRKPGLLLALFAGLGFGAEWLFRKATGDLAGTWTSILWGG